MSIGEDFRTALISSTAIDAIISGSSGIGLIAQGHTAEDVDPPRIWFERASSDEELDVGGTGGIVDTHFNVECISEDVDECQDLADAVKGFLHGKIGLLGTIHAQFVFVTDHDDDYVPRADTDQGLFIGALDVHVRHVK